MGRVGGGGRAEEEVEEEEEGTASCYVQPNALLSPTCYGCIFDTIRSVGSASYLSNVPCCITLTPLCINLNMFGSGKVIQ